MKNLNPPIKHHLVIAALIGAWSFLFTFFSRPFEHGTMDLEKWILVSVGYSVIASVVYLMVGFYQKAIYAKTGRWSVPLELSVYGIFYILYTVISYGYYKSDLIKGNYTFPMYFKEIIVNVILILTPLLFLVRRYSLKLVPVKPDTITIKGENKTDILKIKKSDLICVSNAHNYVEVFFLDQDTLKSKLIRSSLKKIQSDFDFLLQVHRSHLINPVHFKSWKDTSTIVLTQMELPVSKNYKNRLLTL